MPEKPKLIMVINGGMIISAYSDRDIDVRVLDFDTDGQWENDLRELPGLFDGRFTWDTAIVQQNPERVQNVWESLDKLEE